MDASEKVKSLNVEGQLPWFDVTEQMPDELEKVLVFRDNDYEVAWREFTEDGWTWQTIYGRIFNVQAWFHLEAPEMQAVAV